GGKCDEHAEHDDDHHRQTERLTGPARQSHFNTPNMMGTPLPLLAYLTGKRQDGHSPRLWTLSPARRIIAVRRCRCSSNSRSESSYSSPVSLLHTDLHYTTRTEARPVPLPNGVNPF